MPNQPRKTQEQIREDLLSDLTPEEALAPEPADEGEPEPRSDRHSADVRGVPYEAIEAFAAGIAAVESMALMEQPALIMQLARNAYTRARQVAEATGKPA